MGQPFPRLVSWVVAAALLSLPLYGHGASDDRASARTKSGPRIALVIGNSSYPTAPLANPVNDATDFGRTLEQLGFEVEIGLDLSQADLKRAIRSFGERLRADDAIGLFYFAGHGMQVRGRNYIIPIGADIVDENEVEYESVDAGLVLAKMESAGNPLNIVILDACRNNPFARSFRSSAQGLAQMDAPFGSIVAYSTAPGQVAKDGDGRNSPYTESLITALGVPGLTIDQVFKRARAEVQQMTGGKQVPWESTSLTGDFYFSGAPEPGQAVSGAEAPAPSGAAIELELWESVKDSGDEAMLREYLRHFPDGVFAGLARIQIAKLESPPAAAAQPPAPAQIAYLTVRSNVSGDTVYVDDVAKGPTGPSPIEVGAGEHTVRVEKPGYGAPVQTVSLAPGASQTLQFSLGPKSVYSSAAPVSPYEGRAVSLRGQSAFPDGFAVLQESFVRLSEQLSQRSGGRFRLEALAAGALVPPFQIPEAVQAGTLDVGWTVPAYISKDPAFELLGMPPLGPQATQYAAWMSAGGGQPLMDELFEKHFESKAILCGLLGVEGDFWSARPVNSPQDLQQLRIRMSGSPAQLLSAAGAMVVQLPGGEIFPALERGVIEAVNWVGPFHDQSMGFSKVARYYYYPGVLTPTTALVLMVNLGKWNKMGPSAQRFLEASCAENALWTYNELERRNREVLPLPGVSMQPLPNEVTNVLRGAWEQVAAEKSASSSDFRRIYESMAAYR